MNSLRTMVRPRPTALKWTCDAAPLLTVAMGAVDVALVAPELVVVAAVGDGAR